MRTSFVWAGAALFCVALIIYYIYFLDVNECIVEKDSSDEYHITTKQDFNKHTNNKATNHSINTTVLECPKVNLTSMCASYCLNNTEIFNITNTNIIGEKTEKNDTIIANPSTCVNTTIVINSNFSGNESCKGGIGFVVPGVAVLIEPRTLLGIKNATLNIMENLPKHWKIQIFTAANNTNFVQTLLKKYYDSGKILVDGTILGNTTFLTRDSYNNLLVKEELWNTFIAEKVLIYQVDSVICKDSQRDIASFLQYDYIGAPWKNSTWAAVSNYIGNGGFSLRSKSKSLEIIQRFTRNGLNEDGYFARGMIALGANMPSYDEALQFAVERIFYPTPFGVHRFGYKRFPKEQQDQLLAYCPEMNLVAP